MACLKCGRDTAAGEVFCESCIDVMQYYPVKPGTAVQLPKPRVYVRKTPKRRGPTAEEQIKTLKKQIRLLTVALILALLVGVLLAYPAIEHLTEEHFLPGQNYTAVVQTTPPSEG